MVILIHTFVYNLHPKRVQLSTERAAVFMAEFSAILAPETYAEKSSHKSFAEFLFPFGPQEPSLGYGLAGPTLRKTS